MPNTDNLPETSKKGFKVTLVQGIIGAVSLAGTTAVPIIVQRALTPPPTPSPAAEIKPAPTTPATASLEDLSETRGQDDDSKGKGKKKGKKHD